MELSIKQANNATKNVSGKRFVLALLCWGCASLGIFGSLTFGLGFFFVTPRLYDTHTDSLTLRILSLSILLAWFALGVMTKGWLQNRRVSRIWPVVGSIIGIPAAIPFSLFWPLYISAVPLALYLVYFHLFRYQE